MKKILPILTLIGASTLIVGCSSNMAIKKESFINNLNAFKEDLHEYTSLNETKLTKAVFNKYNLSVESEDLQDIQTIENSVQKIEDNNTNLTAENELKDNNNEDIINNIEATEENESENSSLNEENNLEIDKVSTLYSLSNDIEQSCDDFCELKEEITEAIIETQNLIDKLQQKELELTKEQRMFITEQSMQLKNLGRQLSNITTELSFHLSDLNQVMVANNENIDNLNLKYLIVLDNLVNGNEMLQSSLSSLNMINQLFNMKGSIPPNNQGRVLYGFQHNNNPPILKDYYIDENGDLIDNSNQNSTEEQNKDETIEVETNENKTIDTYQDKALKTNIDTYQNTNVPRNIDSFFNTALLDNEFMYGNGAYGYGGMYNNMNPYVQNYANYQQNNTNNSVNTTNNTQNSDLENQTHTETVEQKKEQKRTKLKKNIDTYKDENEPDIKTKLANIKNSISGFFGKFKKTDLNDKIDNPIYRYDTKETN